MSFDFVNNEAEQNPDVLSSPGLNLLNNDENDKKEDLAAVVQRYQRDQQLQQQQQQQRWLENDASYQHPSHFYFISPPQHLPLPSFTFYPPLHPHPQLPQRQQLQPQQPQQPKPQQQLHPAETVSVPIAKRRRGAKAGLGPRLRIEPQQRQILEDFFRRKELPSSMEKKDLAVRVHLTPTQVHNWFQNKRARSGLTKPRNKSKKWQIRVD